MINMLIKYMIRQDSEIATPKLINFVVAGKNNIGIK